MKIAITLWAQHRGEKEYFNEHAGDRHAESEISGRQPCFFLFGRDQLKGFIVEDRGAIGVGGRRLYRVEVPFEGEAPLITELPAEQLQPAQVKIYRNEGSHLNNWEPR